MKKVLSLVITLAIMIIGFAGCSGSPLESAGFEQVSEGTYTLTDTASSPLDGGLKIDVTTGTAGSVKMTITDTDGTETVDYYEFTPADGVMLRHRYVAGMGMTYNYYFDYANMDLVKVTDADDADVTDGMKMSGRWDSAVTETKDIAEKLLSYFEKEYGMTIDNAIE